MQKLRCFLRWAPLILATGLLTLPVHGATVTGSGYTNAFGTQPAAGDWATFSITGASADVTTGGGSDAAVQLVSIASLTAGTLSDAGNPPAAGATAMWSSSGFYLQTRPTGNQATLLMCTLVNGIGFNAESATISFDLASSTVVAEEVDGYRAYYSLTGAAGSWTFIPGLSSATPARLTATLNIAWNNGAPLYILFSDDNGSGSPDTGFQIDNFSATAVPAIQIPAAITSDPVSQTVAELQQPVSFTVGASGNPAPTYQWYTNGVGISGATSPTYNIAAAPLHFNGLQFKAVVQNVVTSVTYFATSAVATLTVNADVVAPVLLGFSQAGNNQVLASFSERLSLASATNLVNYSITSRLGVLTISNAVLDASQTNVLFTVAPLTPGTNYTITVNGVRDQSAAANLVAANSQASFTAANITYTDLGFPGIPGSAVEAGNGFNVTSGGTNISGTSDQLTFGYQQIAGDFDVKVRVEAFGASNSLAVASLMARETLTANSRFAASVATPSVMGAYFESRATTAGTATTAGWFPVNYPYTWLRLQRAGTLFTGYGSFDGSSWVQLGVVTLTGVPASMYVGFAVASANSTQTATAQFRDYGTAVGGAIVPYTASREPLGASSRRTGLVISEIMYHPKPRPDGKQVEFIEIYNSLPIWEDMTGYRLSGDVNYAFPSNTILPGGGFLVLAKIKSDVQSVYGISGVLEYGITNGFNTNVVGLVTNITPNIDNGLNNGGGSVRLHGMAGQVLLDASFDTQWPWPIEADGGGHSLVLARPSYGEGNRLAWAASDSIGGSPGRYDPIASDPARNVVINEFLAHTDFPQEDTIELYNHGTTAVDISGFWLSDTVSTNKFRIPDGTVLGSRGFIAFTASTNGPPHTGFALSSSGEQIVLVNSNQTRVIDAIGFDGQQNGVSMGRYPDGAPRFQRLSAITAGTTNAPPTNSPIVINEIMYNPISGNSDDEFIELYNRGNSAVNIGDWRFTDGIDYTFPKNTVMQPGAYFVVARSKAQLLANNYTTLNATNLFGNYDGSLANGGERVTLSAPDYEVTTNGSGQVLTNVSFRFAMNDVTYSRSGRWGIWSDGGGSSLELIDPRSDTQLAANWADSDESAKSTWTSFEATGSVDDEWTQTHDNIHVYMLGIGEALVDDIEVRPQPGNANIMINGGFEGDLSNWTPQGSHDQSSIENVGFSGAKSLHIRGASRGDPGSNKVRSNTGNSFTATFGLGTVVTLRAKARWLRGFPEVLLRFHGGGMEAAGRLPVPKNLGTPGAVNSQYRNNGAPAVYDVVHNPILPPANAAVVVTARASDPDGLSTLLLRYRLDPSATFNNVTMVDNGTGGDAVAGDGLYSATIPGQALGALAAFHIQAADNAVTKATNLFPANALTRAFPNDAPKHECLVRWGEEQLPGSYSTYHFWMSQETIDRWTSRVRLNNAGLDATFVYNNFRVVYNMQPQFAGSVWHVGQMTGGPIAPSLRTDYVLAFPEDDLMLGQTDFVLNTVGNPSGDTASDLSAQSEQTSYILFRQMGVHYNYRRYIHLFVNGVRRSTTSGVPFIMEDSQQPNSDTVKGWWPDDSDGQLYKIEDRFEYNDAGDAHGGEGNAQLVRQMALYNGVNQLKMAHYRFMFRKRSVSASESANDYTNLFAVVDIVSPTTNATVNPLPDYIVKQLSQVADLEQWMRIFCVQHTCGNWDSYGYRRGKNAYTYRPNLGKFGMMTWDIDFTMGVGGDGTAQSLVDVQDPRVAALYATPEIRRMYWRAYRDMVDGPLNNSYLDPILDAKMAAHQANGVTAVSASVVATIKSYVAGRRAFIVGQIPNASFNFTSATNFTSSSNIVTLTGTAPIEIKYFEINGIAYPVTWTSETAWSVRVPVSVTGSNNFAFQGFGRLSNAIPGTARTVTVDYTGVVESPIGNLVFNEIMYNPLVPGAEYVELFNRATNFTFDLSGWRINGLDYTFPEGATIGPRAFLVLTKDRVQYANAYGGLAPAFDQFTGGLQLDGETLTLIKPVANTNDVDLVVDKVRYDGALPWPAAANGTGSSFQLIDSAQENARVGNWFSSYTPAVYCCGVSEPETVHHGWRFVSGTGIAGPGAGANQMRLVINLGNGEIGGANVAIDDISVVEGTNAAVGYNFVRNGDFETGPLLEVPAVTNSWFIGTNYTNTAIVGNPVHAGSGALKLECLTFGNAQPRVVSQLLSPAPLTNAVHTLSFWYYATNIPGNKATNLTVKLLNSGPLNITTNIGVFITPSNYVPPQLVSFATNSLTPGAANQNTTNFPAFQPLWINELQADNVNGIVDNNGERQPWIELYNASSSPVSLDGLYLSTTYSNLTNFAIPPGYSIGPTQFMVIFCDGEPGESTPSQLHTDFLLPSGSGSIALSRLYTNAPQVLDYINYAGISANRSYGSFPDGQPFDRQEFFHVTAGGTNDGRSAPLVVFINEWMASNTNYLADPADNDYDDWFELYNPSTNAVDIAGYYLTDTLANKFKYLITTNGPHVIPAQGFLLVWADNETGQNVSGGVPRPDLHVNFQLAAALEAIGMFAADGTQIDAINFTNAVGNVSEGRYPNGGPLIYSMPTNQTPRLSNYVPGIGNNPPVLDPIGTRTVFVGQTLSFTATATDPDIGQLLGFTLDAGSPPGASIDFNSGAFNWIPAIAGNNLITVRVTDNGAPALSDYENVQVHVLPLPDFAVPSLVGTELTLSWAATGGRTYQVKYKNLLTDAGWSDLGPPLTLESDGTLTIADDIANSPTRQRYYQLVVLP